MTASEVNSRNRRGRTIPPVQTRKDGTERIFMAELKLATGEVVLFDDEDAPLVNQRQWKVMNNQDGSKYVRSGRNTLLHRLLMAFPLGVLIDHRNGDTFDNRRQNLRMATHAQNNMNKRPRTGRNTPYKGVRVVPGRKPRAYIRVAGKQIYLGSFHTPESAAHAYDAASLLYFGVFARPNFSP